MLLVNEKKNSTSCRRRNPPRPCPLLLFENFPFSRAWGFSPPQICPPHPLARSSCSRRSGADAMPPKRKRRAPPAKSQRQTEPDPQVPPGADAPLEERLIWVSQQESTAPYPPPLYPLPISARECARFQLLVDASCQHIIWPQSLLVVARSKITVRKGFRCSEVDYFVPALPVG